MNTSSQGSTPPYAIQSLAPRTIPAFIPLMKKKAFTLVELLVVIAILALLAAIAIPFVRSSIEKGNASKCMANLRDLGAQLNGYAADKGHYPTPGDGNPIWLELQNWSGITNASTWLCPARFIKSSGTSTFTPAYSANARVFKADGVRIPAVPRPSQVIALIDAGQREINGTAIHQMTVTGAASQITADQPIVGKPITEPNTDIVSGSTAGVRYRHQGAANALFVDGHVESMKLGTILEKNISVDY